MQDFIHKYYELVDEFLLMQFDVAMKRRAIESVSLQHKKIIEFLNSIKFENPKLEYARNKNLDQLRGSSVNIWGFQQFRKISKLSDSIYSFLESERNEIDSSHFLPLLEKSSTLNFSKLGLELNQPSETWIKENDIRIPLFKAPHKLKDILFQIDRFSNNFTYNFEVSPDDRGFFMMATHVNERFFIGYKCPQTLFELSTLAHEIGHTTTPRAKDLKIRFCDIEEGFLINNEVDSYRYEKIFADNIFEILNSLNIKIDMKELSALLYKRKAIQYNNHLLSSKINYLYYSKEKIEKIEERFQEMILQIYPNYKGTKKDWVEFASLEKPLAKLGYLQAYNDIFKE